MDFDYSKFQEFYLKTLQSGNVGVKSVGTKVNMHLKFLTRGIKHWTSHE